MSLFTCNIQNRPIYTDRKMICVSLGWRVMVVRGNRVVIANAYWVPFQVIKVLKLTIVMVAQLWEYTIEYIIKTIELYILNE